MGYTAMTPADQEIEAMALAELVYHADGFTDMAKRGDLPSPHPWIAEALTAEHSGDCQKQPWSCMRCHAEDAMDVARWVAPRFRAAIAALDQVRGK